MTCKRLCKASWVSGRLLACQGCELVNLQLISTKLNRIKKKTIAEGRSNRVRRLIKTSIRIWLGMGKQT